MHRFLTIFFAFSCVFLADGAAPFAGLCGEDLRAKVAAIGRPRSLHRQHTGEGGVWQLICQTDCRDDGTPLDRFSRITYASFEPNTLVPDGLLLTNVVVPEWWSGAHLYADTLMLDLYNVVACSEEVPIIKGALGPAELTDDIEWHGDGTWATGFRLIDGSLFPEGTHSRFYQPPTGYEGDFARVMLYMMALYPDRLDVYGAAITHCDNTGLRQWAVRQLLAWNDSDPVSPLELLRNDRFAAVQGNRNLFVDYPDLAAHIWGDLKSVPYGEEAPAPPAEGLLKARYSVGADEWVWLKSPLVDASAEWSVDGKKVESERLSVVALGVGTHELRFATPTSRGKLLILIAP